TTYTDGDRARSAADPWGPTPGAGSASARGGARPWPRLRSACPGAELSPQRRPAPAFFKCLLLLVRGRASVAGSRLLHRPVDRLERLPAALGQDLRQPEFAGHPGRHFAAGPPAAIGRRRLEPRAQPLEKRGAQHARHASIAPAQIAQRLRTFRVVAGQ